MEVADEMSRRTTRVTNCVKRLFVALSVIIQTPVEL